MPLSLRNMNLLSNEFEFMNIVENPSYHVGILDYNSQDKHDTENKTYTKMVIISFDVMDNVKDPVFKLKCKFMATYQADNKEECNVLKEHVVVAHFIPYLREYVSNITNRMPGPTLMLDPINTIQLWNEYQERIKPKKKTTPPKKKKKAD